MDIIKNHHFVSQFYLRKWSKCGKKVLTTINNSNIRNMNIDKIASSNHLYRIDNINDETRAILLKELKKQRLPIMGDLLEQIINNMSIMNTLKSLYTQNNITKEESILKSNTVEGVYGLIEDLAAPLIEKLINNDIEDFDIDDYQNVFRYAIYQLTRTPKVKNITKEKVEPILENKNIDYKNYHIIMSLIMSEQMLLTFIEKLFKITIMENNTDLNFITNDNPIFNIYPIETNKVKFYLPISPRKALFFEEANIDLKSAIALKNQILNGKQYNKYFLDSVEITREEVLNLNNRMKENSDRFLFLYEEQDLVNT